MKLFLLCLLQSMLLALGQVFLKMSTHAMEAFGWNWHYFKSVLLNGPLLLFGLSFGSAGLLWLWIIKHYPLSQAYPLNSLSYVFGILGAILLFGEKVSAWGWIGVCLIIGGCVLVTMK
ncbi:MAG: EamA family transporter [Bacteroidales bacterium]|jgi:undecaprenyl phosphate-alpha-L-ara4N flippase subunit ArnE|nr:EamA family transporter [Bacteroidales bacterium]MBO7378281.1 EamA family transporter [Bacteroidales bacterium]MBP5214442.1 EamA family transporter [Bacteroidales bacterium]MBP5764445.1 EamA family transporter [Bacteroidales bacterium]